MRNRLVDRWERLGALLGTLSLLLSPWWLLACSHDAEEHPRGANDESADDAPSDGAGTDAGFLAGLTPKDPYEEDLVIVDRFSEDAATLLFRTEENGLPRAGLPIDFDEPPFIVQGLAPDGDVVRYYDFDVRPPTAVPIYAMFREGEDVPVAGQANVVDVIPGDAGYNDFWRVIKVMVPDDYVANTLTSFEEIVAAGLELTPTDTIVNCPIVPDGSSATLRFGNEDPGLHQGWYRGDVVYYFSFEEAPLRVTASGGTPVSSMYVAFNANPEEDGGGPASGFVTEADAVQTHNVVASLPGDVDYSPLRSVNVYDNADFDSVTDLASALEAALLEEDGVDVNTPVVDVE